MRDLYTRWAQRRRYRTAMRELRELPPRHLQQLGIQPQDISRLALLATRG